jgi:hypothetical protein
LALISGQMMAAHRVRGPQDLADGFGRTIWVPNPWPVDTFGEPGYFLVEDLSAYHVAGSLDETDEAVASLVVHGFAGGLHPRAGVGNWRRHSVRRNESVLVKSAGERGMVFVAREDLGIHVRGLHLTQAAALEIADLLHPVPPLDTR